MKSYGCGICVVALVFTLVLPSRVGAQQAVPDFSHTIGLGLWFASGSSAEPGGTGTWRTTFVVLDYKIRPEDSLWGFRLRYGTGGQGGWGGTFSSASGGRDNLWSADVSYRLVQPGGVTLWGFAGYKSFSFETTLPLPTGTRRVASSGLRIGLDAEVPLQRVATLPGAGWNWSIIGTFAWSPSNSVTSVSGGTTTTSSSSATEWHVALRLMFRPTTTVAHASDSEFRQAFSTRLRDHIGGFGVEAGFAGLSGSGWSGPMMSVTYTF